MRQNPYLIIDSSFVLNRLNEQDKEGFLQDCFFLSRLRGTRTRLITPIYYELKSLAKGRFNGNPVVNRGLGLLERIKGDKMMFSFDDKEVFDFLFKKADELGRRRSNEYLGRPLSYPDCIYCAYSIVKSRKGDVIIATKDRMLGDVTLDVFKTAHPVFVSQGYFDGTMKLVKSSDELRSFLSN
jgi:hypothetical protein